MPLFEVVHRTSYRYARPVTFGEHRALLRPRDSHDMRLHDSRITLQPNAQLRWMHDVFGNSVTLIDFQEAASELLVESRLIMERFDGGAVEAPRGETVGSFPYTYPSHLIPDLGNSHLRHYPDPQGAVAAWAVRFAGETNESLALLTAMMQAVKEEFDYRPRYEEGTQPPAVTLETRSGTCRDFALFMMEAARALGFAARFVTGYLYDPQADGQQIRGAGATHAWLQVFLPLSGWVEFDPTNGIVGGQNLIRVGVARDPAQAVPLSGTFEGTAADFLGMEVSVTVQALEALPTKDG